MKIIAQWMMLVFITYFLIELSSYGGLKILSNIRSLDYAPVDRISQKHSDIIERFIAQKTNYTIFSDSLGWSIKEHGHRELYRANSNGIRSNREYDPVTPQGILRVASFGDSFTHCDDVSNENTWQSIIESDNSNLEVLNFGVGGFGLDQAFLRYLKDGVKYEADITLVGFMSENIFRTVNTYRPFYHPNTGIPLAKPRFFYSNNTLAVEPNYFSEVQAYSELIRHPQKVLRELGAIDYFYSRRYRSNFFDWSPTFRVIKIVRSQFGRNSVKAIKDSIISDGYYNESSEAFVVTKKIFDSFYTKIISNNQLPIIVIFPNRKDVLRYQNDNTKRYTPLLSYFDLKGYKYIDLMEAVEGSNLEELFSGHYTATGNKLIADHLYNSIIATYGKKSGD